MMKRVEANDAGSVYQLANDYYHGDLGLLQDRAKGVELWKQAAKLGSSHAHYHSGELPNAAQKAIIPPLRGRGYGWR